MATRKVKHARAMARREEFFKTVREGNADVLRQVQQQRIEEKQREEQKIKDRKIAKSKALAEKHAASKKEN